MKDEVLSLIQARRIALWAAALIVGCFAVGFASLIAWAEHWSITFFSKRGPWLFAVAPLAMWLGWWVVHRFAPEAKGSGIPQVMATLDGRESPEYHAFHEQVLGVRVVIVKVISALLCVLGGGAVGREGPTIQISAAIFHLARKGIRRLGFEDTQGSDHWVVAGSAAGIAAAFNTPLGGLVYAIEELASVHFHRFKTSLIASVILAGLAAQALAGTYLYLGFPKVGVVEAWRLMPLTILVGATCGLAGGLMGQWLVRLGSIRSQIKSFKSLSWIAIGSGLLLALWAVFLDPQVMGPGKEVVVSLLFPGEENTVHGGILALSRFAGVLISYFSGCAGGIFAPSLAAGASLGGWLAELVGVGNPVQLALLGMTAFLTGVTRAPFTAFVLVLEMTDRHSIIFPLMTSALVAYATSRLVHRKGFYEQMRDQYVAKLPK